MCVRLDHSLTVMDFITWQRYEEGKEVVFMYTYTFGWPLVPSYLPCVLLCTFCWALLTYMILAFPKEEQNSSFWFIPIHNQYAEENIYICREQYVCMHPFSLCNNILSTVEYSFFPYY